jgi:hypothetical protein
MSHRRVTILSLVCICILAGIVAYLGLNSFTNPGIAQDNVPVSKPENVQVSESETSLEPEPEASSEPEPEESSEPEPETTPEPELIAPAKPPKRKKSIVIGRSSSESSEEPPIFSTPESPLGTIMTLITMASALVLFIRRKSVLS